MHTFKRGDLVTLSERRTELYKRFSHCIGKVTDINIEYKTVYVTWYQDSACTQYVETAELFVHRLTLFKAYIPPTKEERLALKCKNLWNKSKYVKNNPSCAY